MPESKVKEQGRQDAARSNVVPFASVGRRRMVMVPYVFTKAMEGLRSYRGAEDAAPEHVVRPADLQR